MCLTPRYFKVYNKLSGSFQTIPIKCGKCDECLKDYQTSWYLRLSYECQDSSTPVIFDTLTFNEDSVPRISISYDDCVDGETGELLISSESLKYLESCNFRPTYADSELVKKHFKSGREMYRYARGVRCPMKYFITAEYGSHTGRFHIHLLAWNISFDDYKRFFGIPWTKKYGFCKTKSCGVTNRNKLSSFCRYVSKYCAKGVFDNPLVRDGIFCKPFKLCSNGIGMAYVHKFSRYHLNGIDSSLFKSATLKDCPRDMDIFDYSFAMGLPLSRAVNAISKLPADFFDVVISRYLIKQSNGTKTFTYALPKYIKDKIFGIQNPLSFTLANHLQDLSISLYREQLAKFAYSLPRFDFRLDWSLPFCGLSPAEYCELVSLFATEQKRKKVINAKIFRNRLQAKYRQSFC